MQRTHAQQSFTPCDLPADSTFANVATPLIVTSGSAALLRCSFPDIPEQATSGATSVKGAAVTLSGGWALRTEDCEFAGGTHVQLTQCADSCTHTYALYTDTPARELDVSEHNNRVDVQKLGAAPQRQFLLPDNANLTRLRQVRALGYECAGVHARLCAALGPAMLAHGPQGMLQVLHGMRSATQLAVQHCTLLPTCEHSARVILLINKSDLARACAGGA